MNRGKVVARFRAARKKYRLGQISEETYQDQLRTCCIRSRDGTIFQPDPAGQWLVWHPETYQWIDTGTYITEHYVKGRDIAVAALSIIIALALFVTAVSGHLWIFTRDALGLLVQSRSSEQEKIGAHASDREEILFPGLTLNAPAGSLSGDETFLASEINLDVAAQQARSAGLTIPILHAFEFDAGMTDDEAFPGTVILTLDLDSAGISRDYRDELSVFRIGENGVVSPLKSEQKDSLLTIYTKKNSVIVTGVLSFILAISGDYLRNQSNEEKFGTEEYRIYTLPGSRYNLYHVYWPVHHPYQKPRDTAFPSSVQKDLNQLSRETDFKWDPAKLQFIYDGPHDIEPNEYLSKFETLNQSDAYKRLQKQFNDIDFLLRYVYPEKVAIVMQALMRAHDYLFEERQFKSLSQDVDIVLRDPFPKDYGDLTGSFVDQPSTFPYIIINLPHIETREQIESELKPFIDRGTDPDRVRQMLSNNLALQDGNRDSLHGTMVHELFHVVQEAYHNAVFSQYTHFSESTAVLVESEAVAYFQKKGYMNLRTYTLPTNDKYHLLATEWGNDGDGDDKLVREHGYTFYHVLAYNRDKHSVWNRVPSPFLPALMNEFGVIWPSPQKHLHSLAIPRLMHTFVLEKGPAIIEKINSEVFQKGKNITMLSSMQGYHAVLEEGKYSPYSVKGVQIQVDSKRQSALILKSAAGQNNPPDWLGLSFSQESIGPAMRFEEIPVDGGLFVLPAQDTHLLIAQELTPMGQSFDTGYYMKASLTEQPDPVKVTHDEQSGALVFTFPDQGQDAAAETAGRLLEIDSTHPDIKPFKKIIAPGINEVRIPIEAIIYGEEDKISIMEQMLARVMLFNVRTIARMMTRLPVENLHVAESGGAFVFTRTNQETDEDPEVNPFIDKQFQMRFEAENGVFSTAILTDKNVYLVTQLSVGKLLDYLRYARPLFAKVDISYEKEIDKYESTFTATIRDIYAEKDVTDPYQIPSYDRVMNQSVQAVGGPASNPVSFEGKDPGVSKGVVPGTYTGDLFVHFKTNVPLNVPGSVRVVVKKDQSVSIQFFGETTEGALVATGKTGHYQFLEKVKTSNGVTYQPVKGAFAMFSDDGSLVFTFIPARLRRSQ